MACNFTDLKHKTYNIMDDFRKELRTITNQKEWTEAEKFEAIDELHEKIMAVKLFAIPVVSASVCATCKGEKEIEVLVMGTDTEIIDCPDCTQTEL